MLAAAACCPHPPLLVPEVTAGAAPELDRLRTACDVVVRQLLGTAPDVVVIVGTAEFAAEFGPGSSGTLRPYGVPVTVALPGMAIAAGRRRPATARRQTAPVAQGSLPLSLAIGAWLLGRSPWAGPVTAQAVAASAPADGCAALGRRIARGARRVGLLVMGDGTARRSVAAPGYLDSRAEGFDAAVAQALRHADVGALLQLDADLAAQLLVAGRAAWQVLAGAADGGPGWRSELCYDEAPYGIGYFVASWTRS